MLLMLVISEAIDFFPLIATARMMAFSGGNQRKEIHCLIALGNLIDR
jgi:hypothetical protein